MADRYTETTTTGWGKNLSNSFAGLILGPILIIAAIIILWINEGRINDGKLAMSSIAINADKQNPEAQEKLVSLSGEIVASEPVGDPTFLNPGNYIKLFRKVKVYAWEEEISKKEEPELGGSKTTETTYDYQKKWLERIPSSSNFKYKEGHENPSSIPFKSQAFFPEKAKIGLYTLNPSSMKFGLTVLHLNQDNYEPPLTINTKMLINPNENFIDNYIFRGKGTIDTPEVGDLRISFHAMPSPSNVTAFGKLSGESIVPYFYGTHKFCSLIFGDKAQAIAKLKTEHRAISWLLRLVGFLIMWFGIAAFFNPFVTLLSFIPILSNFTMNLISFVAFVVALITSSVVIIVSMIAHSIIVLLISLLILLILFITTLIIKARRKKSLSTSSI